MSTNTYGAFLPANLTQDGSNNDITTWYLPIGTYTGMILVGQLSYSVETDSSCVPLGFGYWFPISSNITNISISDPSYNNTQVRNYCDAMTVNYNGGGSYPTYGLEFTNVDLSLYSLNVMFGGFTNASSSLVFTSVNPNPNP